MTTTDTAMSTHQQMECPMAPLPDGPLLYVACQSWSREGTQYLDVEEGDLLGIFKWLKGRTYFFAISLKTNQHGWIPTDVAVPMRLPDVEFVAK